MKTVGVVYGVGTGCGCTPAAVVDTSAPAYGAGVGCARSRRSFRRCGDIAAYPGQRGHGARRWTQKPSGTTPFMSVSYLVGREYWYKSGMPPQKGMSRAESRLRAADAFALRASGWSWRSITEKLGYQYVGAAQLAVKAHAERELRDPAEVTYREQVESVRMRQRFLNARFADAYRASDDDRLAAINRELHRNGDMLAKLTGTYQPERQQVDVTVGRSRADILAEEESRFLASLADRRTDSALPEPKRTLDARNTNGHSGSTATEGFDVEAIDAEVIE